ncbi:uncharacterized protein LOC133284249 [Gastrolobium bilobum]|uniref:uncharacterized protein LOC133284249 n=1 Tax=Gastrolobium bilobum TaxID=150636 RepID=UPI002AB274E2|nr:uncharacterized protein LOC133284249 [Gastrolobium bilobum]
MELPVFNGTDPNSWIFRTELYFGLQQVLDALKVQLAGMRMEGLAGPWFQWLFNGGSIQSWDQLKLAVRQRFGGTAYTDLRGVLSKLTQDRTLNDYIRNFEALINQVTEFSDAVLMSFFVSGLLPDLRRAIQLHSPTSLHQAMQLAITYDAHFVELRSSFTAPGTKKSCVKSSYTVEQPKPLTTILPSSKPVLPALPSTVPFKKLSHEELLKKRELGICYTCDEKWNPRHKCQSKFFLLVGDFEEIAEEADEHIVWQPEGTPEVTHAAALHSLKGDKNPRAIQFRVQLHNRMVSILVDSGSSHNFLQKQLVEDMGLSTLKVPRMRVFLGNGEFMVCDRKCLAVPLEIQGYAFTVDLWVIELTGFDIILGISWLSQLGRVIHDYVELSMEFMSSGGRVILQGESVGGVVSSVNQQCLRLAGEADLVGPTILPELLDLKQQIPIAVWDILRQFQSVFQLPQGLPLPRSCDHAIHLLEGARPVNVRPYRYAHHQKGEIEKQVSELLASGFIKESRSPFSSPVLLVKKHDNSWRMCIDYRALNNITIKDRFPIPTIDELLDELRGANIFTKLDLRSGYHQILLIPDDTPKTAFRTHEGHYEFLVMPFGLTNAPSTFQAAMNYMFRPYLRKFIIVFFDDILIYSGSIEEHYSHLVLTLSCLQDNMFMVKLSKCSFALAEVEYLGHLVSGMGVKADPRKIAAMQQWPHPKTIKQLRGFIGLTGYYRRFIRQYAAIASPLTDMLKKDSFLWTEEASKAFEALKVAMTETPVLTLPDFSSPFVVETDASSLGIGAVLQQNNHPIAFFSKKLGPRMRVASTYVRELYALTEAVKKWRHYLLGARFIIRTYHRSLKELLTQTVQTVEQQKYACKLMGYDFSIEYKPGATNVVADSLSRCFDEEQPSFNLALLSEVQFSLVDQIRGENISDPELVDIRLKLNNQELIGSEITDRDGILYHKNRYLLGTASALKDFLLHEAHSTLVGGHAGISRTLLRLSASFFWKGMRKDVQDLARSCSTCQMIKHTTSPPLGLLHPLPIPDGVFEDLSMDFITGLPLSKGFNVILVVVDRLTKFAHFGALANPYTAVKVASLFCDMVVKLHGFPKTIISDRDSIFLSKFWSQLFKCSGTSLRTSTSYHPQTDGQSEVTNRYLEQYLRAFCHDENHKWAVYLGWAEFHYNTVVHSSISMTPFQALYGKAPVMIPTYVKGSVREEAVDATLSHRDGLLRHLRNQLLSAQNRMKVQAEKHRKDLQFSVGDLVLIKLQPYRKITIAHRKCQKLSKRGDGSVVPVPLPSINKENHPVQLPLAAVMTRTIQGTHGDRRQWLIQWTNSLPEDATWEYEDDLISFYPEFSLPTMNLEDKVLTAGGGNVMMEEPKPKRMTGPPSWAKDYLLQIDSDPWLIDRKRIICEVLSDEYTNLFLNSPLFLLVLSLSYHIGSAILSEKEHGLNRKMTFFGHVCNNMEKENDKWWETVKDHDHEAGNVKNDIWCLGDQNGKLLKDHNWNEKVTSLTTQAGDFLVETVMDDKGGGNTENDMFHLGDNDGKLMKDINGNDQELTSLTTQAGDFLIGDQCWSHFLYDTNLWDL